jgi:hypothetical protein
MHPKALNGTIATIWNPRPMLVIDRNEKEENALRIPYSALTLDEALYLLTNYCDAGYFDACKRSIILNDEKDQRA